MVSISSVTRSLGIEVEGRLSLLGHLFGFIRQRVPTDPDPSVRAEVSVLNQIRRVRQPHLHVNIVRVGFDAIPATDLDRELERLDYSVLRMRLIYDQVDIGVGRIEHYEIDAVDADGMDDLASEDEADDLIASRSILNDGVDAFVVRVINGNFLGKSAAIPNGCTKETKNDGVVAGQSGQTFDGLARTFAHEIGHHLGLEHNHGERPGNSSGGVGAFQQ